MSQLRSSDHLQVILSLVKSVIIIQLHIIFVETWTNYLGICHVNSDPPTPIVASNSGHVQRYVALNLSSSMDVLANASQFVESHVVEVVQHNSRRFQNEILGSGQMSQMQMLFVMLCT